jgi:cbb3-type cytochrome oxidase subunit 3
MADIVQFATDLRPWMVVWVLGIFLALVLWALSPARRATYEDCGQIPLRDDR